MLWRSKTSASSSEYSSSSSDCLISLKILTMLLSSLPTLLPLFSNWTFFADQNIKVASQSIAFGKHRNMSTLRQHCIVNIWGKFSLFSMKARRLLVLFIMGFSRNNDALKINVTYSSGALMFSDVFALLKIVNRKILDILFNALMSLRFPQRNIERESITGNLLWAFCALSIVYGSGNCKL